MPCAHRPVSAGSLVIQDLTSRILGNTIADRNRSCNNSRAQTPSVPSYSLAIPRRSLKVGALLSDYRLRPFSFSIGLYTGILLLPYIYSLIITPSLARRKKVY